MRSLTVHSGRRFSNHDCIFRRRIGPVQEGARLSGYGLLSRACKAGRGCLRPAGTIERIEVIILAVSSRL